MNDATGSVGSLSRHSEVTPQGGLVFAAARLSKPDAEALFAGEGGLEARGRGLIRRIDSSVGRVVVRHFRRGGMIGKVIEDRFWFSGAEHTRPFREFAMLQRLAAAGVAVPEVLAARYVRSGVVYTADLATREIPDAETLHERLQRESSVSWGAVAKPLAAMHDAAVWHADLNAHNLLIDRAGAVHIIDLDRAAVIQSEAALVGNLDRLERSLKKLGHVEAARVGMSELRRSYRDLRTRTA